MLPVNPKQDLRDSRNGCPISGVSSVRREIEHLNYGVTIMNLLSRARVQVMIAGPFLFSALSVQAVDVPTVGVNNTRQGWNKFETVLTPANVPRLRKISLSIFMGNRVFKQSFYFTRIKKQTETVRAAFDQKVSGEIKINCLQ